MSLRAAWMQSRNSKLTMNDKNALILRLLQNRYHSGSDAAFLQPLPEQEREKALSIDVDSKKVETLLKQQENSLKRIHYSWFIPIIKKIDKDKLAFVLSLFPEQQALKIQEHLSEPVKIIKTTPIMHAYLFNTLYHLLEVDNVLDKEFLQESEMSLLMQLEKNTLVDLIDFLGLFDLAEEIRHIVAKNTLEQIFACLTKKKLKFLKQCMHQKEKLVAPRLQLESWDGSCQKFSKLLHHKGLIRLGYALSGEHPDLIWHIKHTLDSGRGEKLSRYCSKEAISGVSSILRKQVIGVLNFFKTSE